MAFSIYRCLEIGGRRAIYQGGTEVLPAHQGRGLYGFFTQEAITVATDGAEHEEFLYGWRTRNPIVWAANSRICAAVAPSLLDAAPDPDLQAAGVSMCRVLYPETTLELPHMIMRGAYGHITHRPQAYLGAAALVNEALQRIIPSPADAVFSIGRIRP